MWAVRPIQLSIFLNKTYHEKLCNNLDLLIFDVEIDIEAIEQFCIEICQ